MTGGYIKYSYIPLSQYIKHTPPYGSQEGQFDPITDTENDHPVQSLTQLPIMEAYVTNVTNIDTYSSY